MVTGLASPGNVQHSILLSPRNRDIASNLARRFAGVAVASSNQEVADRSDVVVIAVKPAIAPAVVAELRFRPEQSVISVVSGVSLRKLSEMVKPARHSVRAVPLPSTAQRIGPTAIYPSDALAQGLFAAMGTVVAVDTEDQFEAICAATGTVAAFYSYVDGIASWLSQNGVPSSIAREYIAKMFLGVASEATDSDEASFESLARRHTTAGGLNEQFLRHLTEHGLLKNVGDGLDLLMQRLRKASAQ